MPQQYGQAGKSTRRMAEKRRNKAIVIVGVGLLVVAVVIPVNFGAYGGITIFVLALFAKALPDILDRQTRRIDRTARHADRGARAEEVAGDLPGDLGDDFLVVHDVDSPYGNIDHVVINRENGVFLIETKSHSGLVEVDGGEILLNGYPPEKNFVGQTLQNSYWLRDLIRDRLGVEV
jgi:hypothetical protein